MKFLVLLLALAFLVWLLVFVPIAKESVEAPEQVRTHDTTTTTQPPASSSTAAPTTTTAVARTAPMPNKRLSLSSTRYCEHGVMASGRVTHDGAVSSHVLPRGSSWRVLDGPLAGRVFVVEDTGPLAIFDTWVSSCADAIQYGRRAITVEAA